MILLCERMPHCLLFQLYKAHVNYSIYYSEYPLFVNMQDYYSVLGVSRNASKSEIKSGIFYLFPYLLYDNTSIINLLQAEMFEYSVLIC